MNRNTLILVVVAVIAGAVITPAVQALSPAMSDLKTAPVVACGTTPTLLIPSATAAVTPPRSICVQNDQSATVYVGGSDVTTSTGFVIPDGSTTPQSFCFDAYRAYCVVESSTSNVRVSFGTGYSGK